MSHKLNLAIAPCLKAPVQGIKRVIQRVEVNPGACEAVLHIGMFFDGTSNNADMDKTARKHTNIARLFDAYPERPGSGFIKVYIPGVGTPFPEIGELESSDLGSGFGIGCEERVLYGLLSVFNAVHRRAFEGKLYYSTAQMKALCCNRMIPKDEDRETLATIGVFKGLLQPNGGEGARRSVLTEQARVFGLKVAEHGRPYIKECFVDIFGFSRGAAQARVFCQWLDQLLVSGKFAGIPFRLRFLGIMDTVASAGFWSSVGGTITGSQRGHGGWADPKYLRIPASVENCVHMVAMHELRKNFPLDEIGVDGVIPPRCQQYAYPGVHSDVGGGYLPGELGVSVGQDGGESDALKLAQIPLNHMYECAVAAGAPMSKELL